MISSSENTPLFARYLKSYEDNPQSLVFAPLAECYRKMGLIDKSVRILQDGLKNHPHHATGHVVLAHCYFDLEKYQLAYATLRPLADGSRDNILLQSLYAQTCKHLERWDEALQTYKYLLFLNPKNKEWADAVNELEEIIAPEITFQETSGGDSSTEEDDYESIELFKVEKMDGQLSQKLDSESEDQWSMVGPGANKKIVPDDGWNFHENQVVPEQQPAPESKQEPERSPKTEEDTTEVESEVPMPTHTLVDLYMAQHAYDRALEILDQMVANNPKDNNSFAKREQVLAKMDESQESENDVVGQEVKSHRSPSQVDSIERIWMNFLGALKNRSQNSQLVN